MQWMVCLLAACALTACASSQAVPPPSPAPEAAPVNPISREFAAGPLWLRRGCDRALAEQGKRQICGVDGISGGANSATNPMSVRTGAEVKARANLARRIRTAVKAGLTSYQTNATNGGSDQSHVDVEEISKEITEMTLVGVRVADTYISPEGGVWVMVVMDFDSFRQQVQSLDQYEEKMRTEIVGRAEDLFREIDSEKTSKASPAWLTQFPSACAIGETGPTLVPTDALAEARRKARALLATKNADRKTRSATEVVTTNDESTVRQLVLEQSNGWVQNSEIVTMWYDALGIGPGRTPGSAYAVACPLQDIPPDTVNWIAHWREQRGGPSWLYSLTGKRGHLCVVGVCGPTLNKSDATTNAEDIARVELAEAIGLHAESTSAVLEDDETLYAAVTNACDGCEEKAKAGKVADRWFDEKGDGPLPFAGTAYALMCLDP
jgi:hypothetical protein